MLPALVSLAFLATIWMVVVIAAGVLEENGSKIVAALKGQSQLATERRLAPVPVRVSQRSRGQQVVQVKPKLRAAA